MANLEENQRIIVASFTDAWIETGVTIRADQIELSHLLQMRGLKQTIFKSWEEERVASFTDAWIETRTRLSGG